MKQHVFIVGSKGIPGAYGGYETFVDKLTQYHQDNKSLQYHVACKNMDKEENNYHNARCFNVKVPNLGAAQAIYYDVAALRKCCRYIKQNNIDNPIVYILACRISIFSAIYRRKIKKLGGRMLVNPDGHEWKRSKWSAPVRRYWKISEAMMVKNADLLVCDSKNIESYILSEYKRYNPKTTYISYGAESTDVDEAVVNEKYEEWLTLKGLQKDNYYLIVGRFVPENNYETMIREFMTSKTQKKLAIITTSNDELYNRLNAKLNFESDSRIAFVGTVYDKELLHAIRQNAYGYIHGHEVGGTNPSLLEALGATNLNLLFDVGFNKEVAEDAALYWSKSEGDLAGVIDSCDSLPTEALVSLGVKAKNRIRDAYSWDYIASLYERLFTGTEE